MTINDIKLYNERARMTSATGKSRGNFVADVVVEKGAVS